MILKPGALFCLVAILSALCGACSVVETRTVANSRNCGGVLGTYSLGKTLLKVTYSSVLANNDGKQQGSRFTFESFRVADGDPLCLDYLASIAAKDKIRIVRSKALAASSPVPASRIGPVPVGRKNHGLLQYISNSSEEQSAIVVRKLARAAFISSSGNAGFTPQDFRTSNPTGLTGTYDVVDLDITFDPLDPFDIAEANLALGRKGLCFVLPGYSFDPNAATVQDYCDRPIETKNNAPTRAAEITGETVERPAQVQGILYRPRLDYEIALYTKSDPMSGQPWVLTAFETLAMENLSPVLSIGISRSAFAKQETKLLFEDGDLSELCILKGSEVVGFLSIPLEIVRSVVALPAQIIQVQIDQVGNQQKLANAEAALLAAQRQVILRELGKDTGEFKDGVKADEPAIPTSNLGEFALPPGAALFEKPLTVCGNEPAG